VAAVDRCPVGGQATGHPVAQPRDPQLLQSARSPDTNAGIVTLRRRYAESHFASRFVRVRFSLRERRNLYRIGRELDGTDPRLASMLDMFSRLAIGDPMPAHEQLRAAGDRVPAPLMQRPSREPQ
jgi:hypothetical protein